MSLYHVLVVLCGVEYGMLLVKTLLRDYDDQSLETKADLYLALTTGNDQGYISDMQKSMIVLWSQGYTIESIAFRANIEVQEAKRLLCAAFSYIETALSYYDRSMLFSLKGEVKPEWLLKCVIIAMEEWDG